MMTGRILQHAWPAKAAIVLLCMLCACKDGEKDLHLPIEKMKAVMLDINVAESYSAMVKDSVHKSGTKNADSLAAYYQAIFAHYKISKEIYDRSLAWYKSRPAEMDSLFSAMSTTAARWQDSVK